jgi:serine/threonine protein kinase/WD40 repeat protein
MSGARPGDPASPETRAWLQRVRANVKAQLFGADEPKDRRDETTAPAPAPAPEARDDEPTRIGRFVVIKRIGEGGMGMVYAAYDDALDRKVAVKLLHPRGSEAGNDARTRLIREAQALARLSHPSVIHVYEVDTWQDQVYVAMEFVDGGTLGQWQRQEGRGWREVLEAYVAAGRGLAAAHAAGIVHRDFKAANVLVRRDGAVRVVDFGLARQELEASASSRPAELETSTPIPSLSAGDALSGSRPGDRSPARPDALASGRSHRTSAASEGLSDAPLTRTGVIMGTPAYMAPEQHLGQRADARSDQFSYCVSLFEALYGFRPFPGENLSALRRNVLAGRIEPPPRYTDIPPRIFRALQRGLAVDPHDRHPSMEALLDELAHDPRVALQRAAYVLLALMAVGLVAGLWWSEREERAARTEGERLRAQLERARVLNAEDELRRAQSRSVSERRDDLVLAYAREALDDAPTVALAALKYLSPENADWLPAARTIAADAMQRGVIHRRVTPGLGRVERLAFVDDGRALVMAGRGVARWDPERQALQRLLEPSVGLRDLAVTPDGRRMAAAGLDGALYLWEQGKDAGSPDASATVVRPDRPANAAWRIFPADRGPPLTVALSSDGERIAVGTAGGAVRLLDWSGTEVRTLRNHTAAIRSLDFSPLGDMLASASEDGTIRQWFLERETHWVLEHGPGVREVRFDGEGENLWSTAEDGQVRRWPTAKGKSRPLLELQGVSLLAHTPSGNLALASHSERELVLHREGDPQPLRGLPAVVTALALSADGAWAAAATGDEAVQIWRLAGAEAHTQPDGSRIATTHAPITALAFSQSGSLLAAVTRQGEVQLWSERGEERGTLGQHPRTILDLGFSPQGHELAAIDEDGGIVVWAVADRDQPRVQLRSEGSRRSIAWAWSPDGDTIAAPRCEGEDRCEVVLYPLSLAEPQALATTNSPATALRFSPLGDHLLSDHPTGSWLWDLDEGQGRALEWPEGQQPSRRLAFAYVRGGVRMATAAMVRDEEARVVSTTLRVWHIGQDSGDVHLLFEEPELRTLWVDADGRTLLLRTHDDNTILWRLAGDHFRLLPTLGPDYDRLLVSPDARALLLRPPPDRARETEALWVDVESGQMRRFSRRNDPVAWSSRGTIADVTPHHSLRIWQDPTPDRVPTFLRWLHEVTDAAVDPASIR